MELTPDELLIAARYENGESTIALARDTGISRYEINRILGAAGVKRRRSPDIGTLPDNIARWIVRLHAAGLPASTIGRELGLENSLVAAVVKLNGGTLARGKRAGASLQRDAEPADLQEPTEQTPREHREELPYVQPPDEPPDPSVNAASEEARRKAYMIVAAYLEGGSLEAISERFGYPAWRIVRILKSANVRLLAETHRPAAQDTEAPEGPRERTETESDMADWRAVVEAHYRDRAEQGFSSP